MKKGGFFEMKADEFEKEIDELNRIVDKIINFIKEKGEKLGAIPPSGCKTIVEAKLKEYEQVGNFARHYSITRSGVLTFLVGLSFGITGALMTKFPTPTDTFYHGLSLSFAILLIACFFDRALYIYLLATFERGRQLEAEINVLLNITPPPPQPDNRLKYYISWEIRRENLGYFRIIFWPLDAPTIALWIVTGAYFTLARITYNYYPILNYFLN